MLVLVIESGIDDDEKSTGTTLDSFGVISLNSQFVNLIDGATSVCFSDVSASGSFEWAENNDEVVDDREEKRNN